jgi:hypothetical protein
MAFCRAFHWGQGKALAIAFMKWSATKAHVELHALEQARADLGVVTSRANTGSTLSVQWSLPG